MVNLLVCPYTGIVSQTYLFFRSLNLKLCRPHRLTVLNIYNACNNVTFAPVEAFA